MLGLRAPTSYYICWRFVDALCWRDVIGSLKPPPHQPALPPDKVDSTYRRLRYQVFLGIFIGYAGYYLVRRNFTLAMPNLIELGYSKADLGLALSGVSIAYGLSKFI
ncbi:MAG: hypothetical protein MI919_08660, partial [Holophagales bacterium]|nr:hypothetical protein [Holophagales bacterium]